MACVWMMEHTVIHTVIHAQAILDIRGVITMKAILFRDCKAFFTSFKNWGLALVLWVLMTGMDMLMAGSGILDPFTWAVAYAPFFICVSGMVAISTLYQDFRGGLFDLYMQSGRTFWSFCLCKCVFPVAVTMVFVVSDMALMAAMSNGAQPAASPAYAAISLLVSLAGTAASMLAAIPVVYLSRNSDPTVAQMLIVLVAIVVEIVFVLAVFHIILMWWFALGYVVLAVVASAASFIVFSHYFVNTNIEQ